MAVACDSVYVGLFQSEAQASESQSLPSNGQRVEVAVAAPDAGETGSVKIMNLLD